jgi:hypothetical protein
MNDILSDEEVESLWAERNRLQIQRDFAIKRIHDIDRMIHLSGEARLRRNREDERSAEYR